MGSKCLTQMENDCQQIIIDFLKESFFSSAVQCMFFLSLNSNSVKCLSLLRTFFSWFFS